MSHPTDALPGPHQLTGTDFLKHKKPIVYAWRRRDGTYLYIGSSTLGFGRIYAHDKINILEPVYIDDIFEIWDSFPYGVYNSKQGMRALETALIEKHKPKYNIVIKTSLHLNKICIVCRREYRPTRHWQKKCGKKDCCVELRKSIPPELV